MVARKANAMFRARRSNNSGVCINAARCERYRLPRTARVLRSTPQIEPATSGTTAQWLSRR